MERVLPDLDDFRHWLPVQLRFNDIDILAHLNIDRSTGERWIA